MFLLVLIFGLRLETPGAPEESAKHVTEWPVPLPGDVVLDPGEFRIRPQLGFGWSRPEKKGQRNFRWISHLEADLSFRWDSTAPAEVWLEAAPLYLRYRRQAIALYINHRLAAEWVCPARPGFGLYHARVPAGLLRAGDNLLTLRMAYRKKGEGLRELSLAVDRILLRPAGAVLERPVPQSRITAPDNGQLRGLTG
jgi:hypothetical protein